MNVTKRTCANCAASNFTPTTGDEPSCWNLVSITELPGTPQALSREPGPDDHCHAHQTDEEDAAETALIEENREAGGIAQVLLAASSIALSRAVICRAQA